MWQKSHPSISCFFLGLIFFISGFNLTNLRAINSSFSFSPFIIISQSPKWKNTFKSCLGWNFFWVLGKPKKNLTFLTFYEILERTKEKEMLKHAKKKVQWKMVKNRQKNQDFFDSLCLEFPWVACCSQKNSTTLQFSSLIWNP